MRISNKALFLCLIIFFSTPGEMLAINEGQPTDRFLKKDGIWSGEFTNFVNQKGGVIQCGKIRMKMTIDNNGIINQRIAFFKPDGTVGDYQGYSTMRIDGDRLKWEGSVTKDENTGNLIENHVFEGYIGWNQIYIVEKYVEVFPDGRKEKRKNNLHYVFLNKEKLLWLGDIYLDDQLLVFANTILELEK